MTTQITLPPATRAVGTGNPPGDMNLVTTALTQMQAENWIYPTGDATGTSDTANLNAALGNLPAGGGTVWLAPGTFYITTGAVTITSKFVYIRGSGRWATTLSAVGTGDTLRIYNTDTTGVLTGGGVLDLTIDGTSAGAGSTGLHYGDMRAGELRLAVQNFTGTGSIGVHFDNQNAWTEECHGYLWLTNCTQHIVFDVSGNTTSTNSFGYSDFATEILAKVNQDGVVLQNGAVLYNSRFTIKANFQGNSSSQSNAVLRVTGTVPAGHPNAGGFSKILSSRLDIQAECSNTIGSNAPQTIVWGTLTGNAILGCTGVMDFAQGSLAFAITNWTATGAAGAFGYTGFIRGDFNLNNATAGLSSAYNASATVGAKTYGKSLLSGSNGNMQVDNGDFFSLTLTQSITVSLNPGGGAAFAAAQRKTIIITQASGTAYTVTWPKPGTASTTNGAVYWPGGSAPTMSAGANAVDVYNLVTYDGAHWYGEALQAMS